MKLLKSLAIAGVATILVAGSAFAYNGNEENDGQMKMDRLKTMATNVNNIAKFRGTATGKGLEVVAEVTGKTVEEVKELCKTLREEGKKLVDYLQEQNLLDDVKAKYVSNAEEYLNKLVEAGKLTQEQFAERLESITARINSENFKLFTGTHNGFMHMNFLDNITELTGLSRDELKEVCTELREEGKTIVDYLKEQGLYDSWKAEVLSDFDTRLEQAIENDRITEERAAELKEKLSERIEEGKIFGGHFKKSDRERPNKGDKANVNPQMLELTGLGEEEFKDLCIELRDEGKTIIDYLKDQGLYDTWKQDRLSAFEERIQGAVESGKLTQEQADEMISKFEEGLENGLRGGRKMASKGLELAKNMRMSKKTTNKTA